MPSSLTHPSHDSWPCGATKKCDTAPSAAPSEVTYTDLALALTAMPLGPMKAGEGTAVQPAAI